MGVVSLMSYRKKKLPSWMITRTLLYMIGGSVSGIVSVTTHGWWSFIAFVVLAAFSSALSNVMGQRFKYNLKHYTGPALEALIKKHQKN